MPNHTPELLFFDASHLPPLQNAYVAWVDVMGVRAIMNRSLPITANFVFKLHAAALDAPRDHVHLYPVMDGVYVVATRQGPLREFLKSIFSRVAHTFVSTAEIYHRFIIKGAVAYGPVVHGNAVPAEANFTLGDNPQYRDSILLGMPMIQAFHGEPQAPPYGVYVHESGRAFAPDQDTPFPYVWWNWFLPEWRELARELASELNRYFEWCTQRSYQLEYPQERIRAHQEMASQYLVDLREAPEQ